MKGASDENTAASVHHVYLLHAWQAHIPMLLADTSWETTPLTIGRPPHTASHSYGSENRLVLPLHPP